MRAPRLLLPLALPVVFGVAIAACSDAVPAATDGGAGNDAAVAPDTGTDTGTDAPAGVRSIAFQAKVGDAAFSCSKMAMGVGTTKANVEPLDFRVYVHGVQLVREDGALVPFALEQDGKWQYQDVALLDFEDKTGTCANGTTDTHTVLRGAAPAGTYKGIKFRIGVPFALDHADVATAPSPLNLSGLFWNWNGGYKFARIDARVAMPMGDGGMPMGDGGMPMGDGGMPMGDGGMPMGDGGTGDGGMVMPTGTFLIHLGSTGCVAGADGAVTSCSRPNEGEVSLAGFDPFQKPIVVDYKSLVAGSDVTKNLGGAPGCMSEIDDPECDAILSRFGVSSSSGQANATTQTLFRVE